MDSALGVETSISVTIVGRSAFPALRDEWTDLWRRMDYPTPFASWEWADCWLQTIGSDASLQIAVARLNGRALGILPLVRRGSRWPPAYTMPGVERLYPDHLALIGAADTDKAMLAALLRASLDAAGGIARMELPMVAEGSAMDRACAQAGLPANCRAAAIAPYIRILGSYEAFLAGLSANERYKIRSRSKKLLGMPAVRFGAVPESQHQPALRRLRELHALRAAHKGLESSFDLDDVQDFHSRLIGALPAGTVIFRGLWAEDELVALFYGFILDRRVFYFQLGFDPAWADRSPGIVLLSEVIREAHESGCTEFNFLQGDEPFKRTWTRQQRTLNTWTFYSPGPAGGVRKTVEAGILRSREFVKKLQRRVATSGRQATSG